MEIEQVEVKSMPQFDEDAIKYALRMVGSPDLVLKLKQLEAMKALYSGQDVCLLLPTGYGKSICYESLPFLFDYKLTLPACPSYIPLNFPDDKPG